MSDTSVYLAEQHERILQLEKELARLRDFIRSLPQEMAYYYARPLPCGLQKLHDLIDTFPPEEPTI